ncbi:ABC-three component system protein [Vibrio owensii]|uniref:ABC-three component system protein n=1 Tax=Vibrio owensii TaxID=696485 RepID=UPI00039FAD16|nr:ABC-three component system protein [Vibrio owensii]
MNDQRFFRDLTVSVNGGSGCLFQVATSEYTYVLTARHNIENEDDITITRFYLSSEGELNANIIDVIGRPYFHHDVNKDAAIIKVRKQLDIPHVIKCNQLDTSSNLTYLCGYPTVRQGNDRFRMNNIQALNPGEHGYIEGQLTPMVNQREVSGQSGGGVLHFSNGTHFLLGIQKGMAADDELETLSRVRYMPINFFDEIVSENSDELDELIPPFITTFSDLIDNVYILDSFRINEELVKNELQEIAKEASSSLTPKDIIKHFGGKMLVNGEPVNSIYQKCIWVGMLELFTILKLHELSETEITIDHIPEISKKSIIIYGSVEKSWEELISSIYKCDLSDLNCDGNIFVVTSNDKNPTITQLEPEIIESIAAVSPKRVKVNRASVRDPFKDIRLRHIYDIQKKIIDKRRFFLQANATNIEDILKNETKDII